MNVRLKLAVFISGCALVMFTSCDSSTSDKTTTGPLPTVTTAEIAGNLAFTVYLTGDQARAGGEVTDEGDSAVTERGVCWNTTGSPNIDDDSKWASGSGTGEFSDCLISVLENTVYHVRAYAVNGEGTAYGSEITFNSGWAVGDSHFGGLVFYNDGNAHGLVAYAANLTTSRVWTSGGSTQTTIVGTTRIGIGTGLANTNAIVAQSGHEDSAAKFCLDFSYDDGLHTYDDWFLPSWDELGQMYYMLKARGTGSFTSYFYWSSSEFDADEAFIIYFANGEANWDVKNPSGTTLVRPVRAF